MKKTEKTELTKERIMAAALLEFGTNGYAASSLNQICSQANISKGLIYHNFKSKDAIYLLCLRRCFEELVQYLGEYLDGCGGQGSLQDCMAARFSFFTKNPLYSRLFFEAILQPPVHLAAEIKETRQGLDQLNRAFYDRALQSMTLREGVSKEDALEYYGMVQEMFNGYFSSAVYGKEDFSVMVAQHEKKLAKILDLMLYGISEKSVTESSGKHKKECDKK